MKRVLPIFFAITVLGVTWVALAAPPAHGPSKAGAKPAGVTEAAKIHATAQPTPASTKASTKPKPSPAPTPTPTPVVPPTPQLGSIPLPKLCPTEGVVVASGQQLHVDVGAMRGVIAGDRSQTAELAFTYQGTSKDIQPLASGELRRQIGIKFKAQDTCNVFYVMWQVEPSPGIHVSLKRNVGQSTYAACVDRGYINAQPTSSQRVPAPVPGVAHTMRAELSGTQLRVIVDGTQVWLGSIPDAILDIDGPAGVRSDNGTFDFDLRVPGGASASSVCEPH